MFSMRIFRGIRQNLNWDMNSIRRMADRSDLMTDAAWRRGFSRLRPRNLSFDLQLFYPPMGDAYDLAKAFPDTRIILNHAGMLMERDGESVAAWTDALRHLARAPNVAVKISGLGLGHPGWTTQDLRPLVLTVIDAFGPERCMFGTDLPVDALFL
jgi:predicted TIM-barrel fold metal-dependent hydrolase